MLATLAITQPLLSTLGENPTFFIAHSASPGQMVAFTAIVSLAPAAVLGTLMLAGHAVSAEAGERVFYASMAVLAFVFVLQVVDAIPGPAVAVVAVAAVVGYGLMVLYSARGPVRSTVSLLAVFPVAVVALFLFHSPASSIVFPADVEAVALDDLLGADFAAEHLAADSPTPASSAPSNPAPASTASASSAPASTASASSAPASTASASSAPASTASASTASASTASARAAASNTAPASSEPSSPAPDSDAAVRPASMVERLNDRFPPIYVLVLDELPWASLLDMSGRIDAVRYPNFARLGATSHVFTNATTVAFTTEEAVPALLSGTLQAQPAPVFSLYPNNLFTLLGGVYDVSSSDPLVDLCPPAVCNGSPPEQILELIAADEATRSTQPAASSAAPTTTASRPTTTAASATTASRPTTTAAPSPTASEPTTTAASATTAAADTTATATATTADSPPPTGAATPTATATATASATATTTAAAGAASTAAAGTSTTLPVPAPADGGTRSDRGGSLSLLLKDAAIVFGHLASPEGVDFGLPSIGATWGSFGRASTVPSVAADAPEPDPATAPESSAATTTTATIAPATAPESSATTTTTATIAPTTTTATATAATATAATAATTTATTAPTASTATTTAATTTATTAPTASTATAAAPTAPTTTTATATAAADTTHPDAHPVAALPTGAAPADPTSSAPVDPQRVAEERMVFLDSLITSDSRVADFRAEVAAMETSELPRLHYLHSLLPHVPWRFRPDGSTYADIDLPGYFSQWDENPAKAHFGQQRHLLQLGLVDRLLGEYLDRLEAIGDFDRATVIVTADHGISFVPGERSRGIGEANAGGIANVPLLYKEPGQRAGTVQTRPVQLIDVVPTIAARLELDPPWTFDGHDMLAAGPDPDRRMRGPYGIVDLPGDLGAIVGRQLPPACTRCSATVPPAASTGLGGAHDLIGTQALDWATDRSQHCWILERPATVPDADGAVGYAYVASTLPPVPASRWRSRSTAWSREQPGRTWKTRSIASTPSATRSSGEPTSRPSNSTRSWAGDSP